LLGIAIVASAQQYEDKSLPLQIVCAKNPA